MNKLLAITSGLLAAGVANAEFTMPAFNINSKIAFETAHVSEGRRTMDQNFAPSIEIGLPLFGAGDLYVGLDAYLMANSQKEGRNEFDPYVGFSYDVTDMFTLDLGYTYKRFDSKYELTGYTDVAGAAGKVIEGKKYSHEIYAGVMADVLLNPSIYFSYDLTQKKADIEGALGYTLDLGSFGAKGLAIDLGAKAGYSRVTKPFGIKRSTTAVLATAAAGTAPTALSGTYFAKKGWFYGALSADLVYGFNDNAKARAGVAFSFNNAKKDSWINSMNAKKHNVWFSSAVEFAF